MTRVFVYVVAAAGPDPDRIQCAVPWEVDDQLIFFGPCKKRLRDLLKRQHFSAPEDSLVPLEDLYLVGLNPSNANRERAVLWAGRVGRFMTFARAYADLDGPRFEKMRRHSHSPLHLRPLVRGGELVGYEHVGLEHGDGDAWIDDIVRYRHSARIRHEGRQVFVESPWRPADAFDRDVCFLLDNIAFAKGQAGPAPRIDETAVDIFRRAQPDRTGIDPYAVFGYRKDGSVDGRTGSYLEVSGNLGNELIEWVFRRAQDVGKGRHT